MRPSARFLIFIAAQVALVSVTAAANDPQRSGFRVRHYELPGQLGSNVINDLAQTSDGYLWVGTDSGLQRFNGDNFVSASELLSIQRLRVNALLASGQTLYAGTAGRGLVRIIDSDYTRFSTAEGLADDVVWDLAADGETGLWIATSSGISNLRGDTLSTVAGLEGITSQVVVDGEGQLWVSYSDGSLRQTSRQGVINHVLAGEMAATLLATPDGTVFVGTDRGLRRSTGRAGETVRVNEFPATWVVGITWTNNGSLWAATADNEFWQLSAGDWQQRYLAARLPGKGINVLYADNVDGLWVGTRAGLALVTGGAIVELGPGLSEPDVWAVTHDTAGRMWMATGGSGISEVDAQAARLLPISVPLPSEEIWALSPSPGGGLWAGSGDAGAFLIHEGQVRRHVTDLPTPQVWTLLETADGTLLIGTDGGGLVRFKGGEKTVFDTASGMPGDRIWALHTTDLNTLWVGTNHGLCRLQYDTPVCYSTLHGLPGDAVWSIAQADEHNLWISTDGGLAQVTLDGTIYPVTREPLGSANVFGIQYDASGNLWVLSAQGLHRVNAKEIAQLTATSRSRVPVGRTFGEADGLNQTLTSGASPPMTVDAEGGLWLATRGGLILVDTSRLFDEEVQASLRFESLHADGTLLPSSSGTVTLQPGVRVLQIGYTPLSLRYPEDTLVQHRLRGFSDRWSVPTRDRILTYSNLAAGTYTLELKVAPNSFGIVSAPAEMKFIVEPYWHEMNSVRLALLIAGILLLVAAYRWRVGSMFQRHAEREESMRGQLEVARALADSERRFKDIFHNVTDLVFSVDSEGMIAEANPAAQRLLPGCRIGVRLTDVLPKDVVKSSDCSTWRFNVSDDGGHERTLDIHSTAGQKGSRLYVGRDVSEELFLQERIAAAQRIEAVGNLTAGVAHDFNNLLTVIHGNATLLTNELTDSNRLQMANAVVDSAERAADITRKLLSIGRRQPINPRPIELNGHLNGMADLLQRLIRENIQIRFSLCGQLVVEVDTGLLEQIILNLVVNARDAIEGAGEICVATQSVDIDEAFAASHPGIAPGSYALLSITDTGTGMDAQTAARAFEPFFTTKGPATGTGLGLATVYGAVKQCGGAVYIDSKPGDGSRFDVYLPCAEQAVPADAGVGVEPAIDGNECVLLAEDDPGIRLMARTMLEARGYQVETANGIVQAMRVFAAGRFDLLLTDVVMPDGSGPQLVEQLRARGATMPVLYMSGYSHEHLNQAHSADSALLTKPFTIEQLSSAVRRLLDNAGRAI